LEAIAVLRTKVDAQGVLWETLLPPEFLRLPPGLSEVDRLLDDPVFFEPFVEFFDPQIGRPSIPMETYLRMMFLRFRYRLGFETLCAEVTDSLAWRRFCRIGLTGAVPHPTTLMKITTRCGSKAVAALNEALLSKANAAKVVKLDKVRADTTVIEANVSYPSDAGLLGKGVAKVSKLVGKLKAAGYGSRTAFRDRRRSVAKRSHAIAAWLKRRSDDKKDEVLAITAELVTIARASVKQAQVMAQNTRRSIRRAGEGATGRSKALLSELEETITVLDQVIAQTKLRLEGGMPPGSTRVVSLHDPDARPIAKGRLGRPVEFGFKAQVLDNADGIVLDHEVMIGNPPDAPLLAPAIGRVVKRFRRVPRVATADRGYGEARVDDELCALGVKTVVIPRKGRANAERHKLQTSRSFLKLVKWRTGSEGRISHLKHSWGWNRTLLDGIDGARTWCGWGVLAHNATKVATLVDARERERDRPQSSSPTARGPCRPPPPTKAAAV
jgi:IS5 family transposase